MELIYQKDEQTDKVLVNEANLDWLLSPHNINQYFRGNTPVAVFVNQEDYGVYYHCVSLYGNYWVIWDFHRDDGFIGGGGLKFDTPAEACEYLLAQFANVDFDDAEKLDFHEWDDHYDCDCCSCDEDDYCDGEE